MEWTRAIDGYCERLDASYWAEPVNALTNLAFLLAAAVMWRRLGRADLPLARMLCALLAAIGVGSWLFHTHATVWASMADVIPIGVFILAYVYTANRGFWHLSPVWAALGMLAFLPYAALTVPVFRALPGFAVSAPYWPVPLLIALYAAGLWRRNPPVARGLAVGAGLLVVSLTFRSLDQALCPVWPMGTHFLWHLINAAMLGWMIEVYRRAATRGQAGLAMTGAGR